MSATEPPADNPDNDTDPYEIALRASWEAPPDTSEPWEDPYFDHDHH
jgi:hypothetical protein